MGANGAWWFFYVSRVHAPTERMVRTDDCVWKLERKSMGEIGTSSRAPRHAGVGMFRMEFLSSFFFFFFFNNWTSWTFVECSLLANDYASSKLPRSIGNYRLLQVFDPPIMEIWSRLNLLHIDRSNRTDNRGAIRMVIDCVWRLTRWRWDNIRSNYLIRWWWGAYIVYTCVYLILSINF